MVCVLSFKRIAREMGQGHVKYNRFVIENHEQLLFVDGMLDKLLNLSPFNRNVVVAISDGRP